MGDIRQGLATGKDSRFLRMFWEAPDDSWVPFAKGGEDAWLLPRINKSILWGERGEEVRRYSGGNGTPSEELYFREGLTYTVAKRSGRRFGYLNSGSIFGHKGSVFIPDRATWQALSYTNSRLFTYLMLCQTSERMWEVGTVSKVPWREELEKIAELEELSKEAVALLISKRQHEFVSPYYDGPHLLAPLGENESLPHYDHPHRELRDKLPVREPDERVEVSASLSEIAVAASRHLEQIEADLQSCSEAIDEAVFNCFDINDKQQETILQEIALRTIEDPRETEEFKPESITEPTDEFPEMVKNLILHFAIKAIHEDDDGIVPISEVQGEKDILACIEEEFERVFGEYADDRLAEADQVLGTRSAAEEAYPNLRYWLENELFEYHVSKFEQTPIIWRLTTKRLIPDSVGEGFTCLVDYHQTDANLFDRLQNRYLESRKTLLRERRSAANERRNDAGLSASEQAEATETFERCDSGLQQLNEFEEVLRELSESSPRDWSDKNRELARNLKTKVRKFREQTESYLDTLDDLASLDDVDMEALFSETFYDRINENRDEWSNGLEDLERACKAYSQSGDEPVEANLYDLFSYFEDDLLGTVWPTSTGILLMTYYFEDFESGNQMLTDEEPSKRGQLLSELAEGVEEYQELGEEISESCNTLSKEIPSDWETRALSEVTTAGYQPKRKHGVVINITPLAEKNIVPEIVEDKVL
ncbi:MAG: BREX-5 system adenine-specific DNA-methyltransferase PglX [Halobacteriaceae archaeon]